MFIHHLASVDGEIVYDLDPEVVPTSAGGTRLAEGVTLDETALLARSMTYKFAAFERRMGGAKAGIRPRLLDSRSETMERFVAEVAPLVASRRFLTGPDLGTRAADFVTLAEDGGAPSVFDSVIDGVPFEELVTGRGVVAAAEAALGSIEGRTFGIEGFGNVGGGVARDVVRRGGRVVAVSTVVGAVADAEGFSLAELFDARAEHGDEFVRHLDREVRPATQLFGLPVDVLVPGARVGVLTPSVAETVQATVVAPAANVPYTLAGLDVLRAAGVVALPDFVCNGGAVLAHVASPALTPKEVLASVDRQIGDRITAARLAKMDQVVYAAMLADTFLTTWVPADLRPDAPAFADRLLT